MHRCIGAYVAYIYIAGRGVSDVGGFCLVLRCICKGMGGGRKMTPKSKQTVKMLKPDAGENESLESLFWE